MASAASSGEVLSLLLSLLRTSRQFADYNIREYAKRRTLDAFRHNKDLSDPSAAFSDGRSKLEVARRQALIYSLCAPKVKSVMDIKKHST